MFKIWRYTIFFLVCLLVALIINLPLVHGLPWVKLPPEIQVSGVDGTVLRGKAQQITINEFPVRGVSYRYLPSCVALLKVCYRIEFDDGRFDIAYDLLHGDTELSKARVAYPVTVLTPYFTPLPVQPIGRLELNIDDLSMLQGKPANLVARLVWRDLGIDDPDIKMNIGDYQLDISGKSPNYDLLFSDHDAHLTLKGDGEIAAGGVFKVDVSIEPRTEIDPHVKYVLELITEKVSFNKYRIRQDGRLPPQLARHL